MALPTKPFGSEYQAADWNRAGAAVPLAEFRKLPRPTGGTFTLTVGGVTTSPLPYNTSPEELTEIVKQVKQVVARRRRAEVRREHIRKQIDKALRKRR